MEFYEHIGVINQEKRDDRIELASFIIAMLRNAFAVRVRLVGNFVPKPMLK